MARHELVTQVMNDSVLKHKGITRNVRDLPIAVAIMKTYKDDITIIERKMSR